MDLSRRNFMVAGVASLASLPGGLQQQIDSSENEKKYTAVAFLYGTEKPPADFFEDKGIGAYLFQDPQGRLSKTEPPYNEWTELPTHLVTHAHDELPTDPPSGSLFYDTTRGTPTWYNSDHYEWPGFVDDVLIEPETVSNTTSRTAVWNPEINTGSLVAGRTYQVDIFGDFSTANNSSRFTVYANFDGTDLAGIQSTGENVSAAPWSIEFTYTIREDGQNGTLIAHTRGLFNSTPDDSDSSTFTVDTTTVANLTFEVEWNEANTGNTVRLEQAHLKQMG